jgi:Protein of unknown function (DUF4231)
VPDDANAQLLTLNHEIRRAESSLIIARRRSRLSNLSLIFGPVLLVLLYGLFWIPHVDRRLLIAIYLPSVPVALFFFVAAVKLKVTPGGPPDGELKFGEARSRPNEYELELQLARQREHRKFLAGDANTPIAIRRISYKDEAREDIDEFRAESTRYRRVNNMLQAVLIIGSLAATGTAALTGSVPNIRWVTLGMTFVVGIASGFMGYFKYKERSFYLQQTADAIESEWEAVEVGIGRYEKYDNEEERLAQFVEEVHHLKSEQKKRQQNLEQPELRHSQEQ